MAHTMGFLVPLEGRPIENKKYIFQKKSKMRRNKIKKTRNLEHK